jgi:hypothetical protein
MKYATRLLLAIAFLFSALAFGARPAAAEDIQVTVTAQENKWPEAILFTVEASSSADLKALTLNYSWGRSKVSNLARATFDPAKTVKTQIEVKTSGRSYIPPFSVMKYTVTAEDTAGNVTRSAEGTFVFEDTRFRWSNVQRDMLTVYYHGNSKQSADIVLDAGLEALADVSKFYGVQVTHPLKAVLYNSKTEIDGAIPFRSETTRRELVIEGQAHNEYDLVLVMEGRNLVITIRHEITHVVTHQATDSAIGGDIPFWLNEGLSVFNQGDNGADYQPLLLTAIRRNQLIPIRSLTAAPGVPEQNLLGYAEGYSIVKYMVEKYGPEKMAALLAAYKEGNTDDGALRKAYGFDRDQLDREWRAAIGAQAPPPQATPAPGARTQPQPTPAPPAPGQTDIEDAGSPLGALTLLFVGLGGVLGCVVVLGLAGFLLTLALRRR